MRFIDIWKYIEETPNNINPTILKQMIVEYGNFFPQYTVDADIDEEVDLLGKSVVDLQTDVTIVNGIFSGILKKVTDYTGFSDDPAEQEGYYLVFHIAYDDADTIKVNGVTLDEDGIMIKRLKGDKSDETKISVEIIRDEISFKDYLDCRGLQFDPGLSIK